MSEKPSDGTVAMHYGEIEDGDFLAAEDYLPTLPNTVSSPLPLELVNTGYFQFLALSRHDFLIFDPVNKPSPQLVLENSEHVS